MTEIFREHPQRVILETFDPWDMWWEETWPDQPKDYDKDKDNDKDKPNDKNISRTLAKSAFETFDQSDEEIWPDLQKRQWQWQLKNTFKEQS